MLDDQQDSFAGKAAKEIKEETGLELKESELLDMTKLALEGASSEYPPAAESLEEAMYPSPGACDEFITLYLCQKRLKREHLEDRVEHVAGWRGEAARDGGGRCIAGCENSSCIESVREHQGNWHVTRYAYQPRREIKRLAFREVRLKEM